MEILERYAASGDNELLPSLADYLCQCNAETIPHETALSAVRNLAHAIERKKAQSAWVCLWRLSYIHCNWASIPFLEDLQDLPEFQRILDRCVLCLTHAPRDQRLTCLKFLTAIMDSQYRRRKVCETPGLAARITTLTKQIMDDSPVTESFHAIVTLSFLAVELKPDQLAYCSEFLSFGALPILTRGFQIVFSNTVLLKAEACDDYGTYFSVCLHGVRQMWALLSQFSAVGTPQHAPEKCLYDDEQIASTVVTLFCLQGAVSSSHMKLVLYAVWGFISLVDVQRGEKWLLSCLIAGGHQNPVNSMLVMFARNLLACGDETLAYAVYEVFQYWREVYPSIATFVSSQCAVADCVASVILDGARFAPAAGIAPNFDITSPRIVEDSEARHCAYPGCVVTGVESEIAATTLKCGRCKAVYYCSKAHQREHWPAHRATCKKT